jgi:hypothetical protein
MATIRQRPLTPEERARLEARVRQLGGGGSLAMSAVFLFMILFLAGVALVALFDLPRLAGRSASGLVAGLAAARVYIRMRRSLTRSPGADLLRSDLAGGVAAESSFDVVEAIEVEELEDEGMTYYLKLSDGGVLFLSGQYLDDDVEAKRFPSTRIVTTRLPHTRLLFDFRCEGSYLAPTAKLPHFTSDQRERGEVPEDGAIVDLEFEALRRGHSEAAP